MVSTTHTPTLSKYDNTRRLYVALFLLLSCYFRSDILLDGWRAVTRGIAGSKIEGVSAQCTGECLVAEKVKDFSPIVEYEIDRGGYPFPAELILSIIHVESKGIVGVVNSKSGASGLMQIMPIALKDYNQRNGTNLKMADMKGKTKQAAILQIKVGIDLLGWFWKRAFGYLKPKIGSPILDDLAQIAQLFYVAGVGGARRFLDNLSEPTFANAAKKYPEWSGIKYVKKVWRLTSEQNPVWNMDAVDRWVSGEVEPELPPPLIAKTPANGLLLALMIVAFASYYLKKK